MNRCQGRDLSCEEIYRVLNRTSCTRLATCGDGAPYIVPMNFTWDCVDGRLHFFLTSRYCGEKMRYLRRNNRVALEFELCNNNCTYTVVARGVVQNGVEPASDETDCGECGNRRRGRSCNSCDNGCGNIRGCSFDRCSNGCEGWNDRGTIGLDISVNDITGRAFRSCCEA